MPGTPIQQPTPKEDHIVWADRQAREIASKYAHPLDGRFAYFYWQVMAGYGFRPYVPGGIAEYHRYYWR
jgi:hypothetical protein